MPKVTINSTSRDGGKIIISAQIEFDEKEFTTDEAEQFVKSAINDAQNKRSALAAIYIDDTQTKINRQLGVSP